MHSKRSYTLYKNASKFLKYVWPFWDIILYRVKTIIITWREFELDYQTHALISTEPIFDLWPEKVQLGFLLPICWFFQGKAKYEKYFCKHFCKPYLDWFKRFLSSPNTENSVWSFILRRLKFIRFRKLAQF